MLKSARVDRIWRKRKPHGWMSWCALFGVRLATGASARGLRTLEAPSSEITHVTQGDIRGVLSANKCQYVVGHASFLIRCPFCKNGQEKTLFVNKTTGSVVCKPCGVRGSWSDFLLWIRDAKKQQSKSRSSAPPPSLAPHASLEVTSSREGAQRLWETTTPWDSTSTDIADQVKQAFGIQKLHPSYLKKYCVRTATAKFSTPSGKSAEIVCVALPWYDSGGGRGEQGEAGGVQLVRVKLETLADPMHRQMALEPREGSFGLFGWNTIPKDAKQVVITANEFDAVAVNQSTGIPAVGLPTGTSALPPEVLPQLEQFEKIYLWLGSDTQARQAATQFARKLNIERCYLVGSREDQRPLSIALEALTSGQDMMAAIKEARPFVHKQIVTFRQLRAEVLGELTNAEQVAGVKWKRFPKLTSILKGHRPGELTVFTGPTGSGKTTLMSELSLDLCQQGVTTLWGSFEIRNVRLAKTMLKQYSGLNLERHLHQYEYWADKFQQLPLYFMGFFGPVDIQTVIETMSHAAYVHDIQHVIVDNLQFMVGSNYQIHDRYTVQNQAIAEFRKFASAKNIHVSVVIHPRKEDDAAELTTASIFGTAKASQEADNVVILQAASARQKSLQVTKNRFDGDLGKIPLDWDKVSLTLSGHFKPHHGGESTPTEYGDYDNRTSFTGGSRWPANRSRSEDEAARRNVTMDMTTKTPNTSQRFPKPLLKSTAKLKIPSPSLRSALASASSVTTLASQANGTSGRSREGEGRRRGDGRWNRGIGQGKREDRMEVKRSGESILDTVTVEDVKETTTWEEDELEGSRRWDEEEEGGRKWEDSRRQEEEEGGRRREEEEEGSRRPEEEEGGRRQEEKLPTMLSL